MKTSLPQNQDLMKYAKGLIKNLLIFLFSFLLFYLKSAFADRHHYVEGLKIGDSLLDYHSAEELSKVEDWLSFSDRYSLLDISQITKRHYFGDLNAAVKKDDPNFIIQGLQGIRPLTNISECEEEIRLYDKFWQAEIKEDNNREEINMRATRPIQEADLHIIQFTTSSEVYSVSCWKLDEKWNGFESIYMLNIENLEFSEYGGAKIYLY